MTSIGANPPEIYQAHILIVDDVRDNLRLLADLLVSHGYIVRPVPHPKMALISAKKTPPDLILLDIMMPEMSGFELCEKLKADDTTRDIPVIFISALNQVFDKVKAFAIGGVDYITKPFQPEEVLVRVRTHLMLRKLQESLQIKNRHLQQEINERRRVEGAMRQRNRELAMLNQMNTRLQSCLHERQTYSVVQNICQELFPSDSGALYMLSRRGLHLVASWGAHPSVAQIIDASYWQMPRGEIYSIDHQQGPPLMFYLEEFQESEGYPCALRDASGEVIGILFSRFVSHENENERSIREIESKQLIVTRLAEQYSLFLSTLRLRERLKQETIRDPLTNLFNRRYLEESLSREVLRARRSRTTVGIIMIDVDHFKIFNDTHGHKAGDGVLQELGDLLLRNIRGGDIACRYGGEEFLLILPDTTLDTTEQRARELLQKVRTLSIPYQENIFHITVSLGIAIFPVHGSEVHSVVEAADTALYQAKHNGRNQAVVASMKNKE